MHCHVSHQISVYAHQSGMAELMDDEEREAVENMREEFVAKATSGECNEEAKQTIEALCQTEPDELDRQFIALLSASPSSLQSVQNQAKKWFEMHAELAASQSIK